MSINGWLNKENVAHPHTHTHGGILFRLGKEGSSDICDHMEGSWGLYAKWDKKNRERQILNGIT